MAKSAALATSLLGKEALQERSFILAHGSSTPLNRVTESLIYHKVAQTFAIDNWKVTAPKAYVGHTIAPASGDQLAIALGVFSHNIMPGITTIDKVADDVYTDHLDIRNSHYECSEMDSAKEEARAASVEVCLRPRQTGTKQTSTLKAQF